MKLGHKVVFLQRIAQGPLRLGKLALGKWRMLSKEELATLKSTDFNEAIQKPRFIAPRIAPTKSSSFRPLGLHQKNKHTLKKAQPK